MQPYITNQLFLGCSIQNSAKIHSVCVTILTSQSNKKNLEKEIQEKIKFEFGTPLLTIYKLKAISGQSDILVAFITNIFLIKAKKYFSCVLRDICYLIKFCFPNNFSLCLFHLLKVKELSKLTCKRTNFLFNHKNKPF